MSEYDFQALAKQFWDQGYLVLEGFFEQQMMDEFQQMILAHYGDDPEFFHNEEFIKKSYTEVIPWFPQREGVSAFNVIDYLPAFQSLTQAVLGEGWSSQYSMVMYSKQGTKGQAWHQDCPSDNPSQFNVNRLIYTMDIDDQVGGQVVIKPGTHKQGVMTVGDVDEEFDDQVVLSPNKGTLVLLHGHTWHKITPVTGKFRVSTNYRCAPKGVPDDITDICVYRNMRYQFSTNRIVEDRLT